MTAPILGVFVGEGCVCGALVDGMHVVWRASETGSDSAATISRLIASMPVLPGLRSARLCVGHHLVRTRRIVGLPAALDSEARTRFVAEHPRQFFVTSCQLLGASRVAEVTPGALWGALYDADAVRSLVRPFRTAGIMVEAVFPAPFALAAVSADGTHFWPDGARALVARTEGQRLAALTVAEGASIAEAEYLLKDIRGQVHDHAEAAAVGAALAALDAIPSALDADPESAALDARRSQRVVRIAGSTLAGTVVFACTLPLLVAYGAARSARREIAAVSGARRESVALSQALTREGRALTDVHALTARRRSRVADLAILTRLLPDSCAISSAQFDSGSVELVLISPGIADVIRTLDQAPEVTNLALIGGIGPASGSPAGAERATVRFRLGTSASPDQRHFGPRSGG